MKFKQLTRGEELTCVEETNIRVAQCIHKQIHILILDLENHNIK